MFRANHPLAEQPTNPSSLAEFLDECDRRDVLVCAGAVSDALSQRPATVAHRLRHKCSSTKVRGSRWFDPADVRREFASELGLIIEDDAKRCA